MKYERFEDLPVWQASIELARKINTHTRDEFYAQPGELRDQLRRAALSVSNNIAEGFERGSTAELIAFLNIARGSAGAVRSMLQFANGMPAAAHLKSEISNLRSLAESCSRQIRAWADHLQNTDIQGPWHLNDQSRAHYEEKQTATAFRADLARRLHRALPHIYPDPEKTSPSSPGTA